MYIYSNKERENEEHALPDIEIFYYNDNNGISVDVKGCEVLPGWYYWYCFPGCFPDSDPAGPFETEQEAIKSAQEEI